MDGALAGAALGKAVSDLYDTIKDVTGKTLKFDEVLEHFKGTLARLKPVVEEIEGSNRELGRPEEINVLIEKLKKSEDRVKKYSKLTLLKHFMRFYYANKLSKSEDALIKFFQIDGQAWILRTGSEILKGVNDIRTRLDLDVRNGVGSCGVPEPPDFTVGLDVPLKELKLQLRKEDVSMLVLTAPGGCGKTTLVTMLCRDSELQGKYGGNIIFIRVSKSPNRKVIVQNIFHQMNEQVPHEFPSDEDAINQLKQLLNRMKQTPVLLILDDVWSGSESLLDQFAFRMPNHKILVTSRTAFPRFPFRYNLKPLNDEAAMKLFHHSAILNDGNSYIPDREIVKKIVKGCGGFPLALKVIGRSLCGKSKVVWRKTVMEWSSNDHSILASSTSSYLLDCLQRSLDFKDDEIIIKKCFLDLGSFPEDQRIPVAALVDMWSELYELDEDGILAVFNLDEITTRNLASLLVTRKDVSEVGIYCSEDFVLLHDLLRELAIHQSSQEPIEQRKRLIINISGNNLPKWWREQRQQPISAQLLSISTDDKFSSSWCNIQGSEVQVLVLNFQTKNYALPNFVEKMEELKVLIVTNYGFLHAELGNFQLLGSLSYLKKIRLEKVSIPSIFKFSVQLKSLEKISLFMCNIGHAFRDCTIQVSDAFPNLKEINIDYCNDLAELPKMLYDQGQLANVYLDAFSITKDDFYSCVSRDILDYLGRDMIGQEGEIFSAEDADSAEDEGATRKKEGAFYIWTSKEIDDVLGEHATLFKDHYYVKPLGNCDLSRMSDPHHEFKEKNVLIERRNPAEMASKLGMPVEKYLDILGECRQKLFEVRSKRPRPHLDDKVIVSWNGLIISSFARASKTLKDGDEGTKFNFPVVGCDPQEYMEVAEKAASFIRRQLYNEQTCRLQHSFRNGPSKAPGFLDDYAFLISGLLDLFEFGGGIKWLLWATELQGTQDELFLDREGGGYFNTPGEDPSVLLRVKEDHDGAEPSGNSISAINLVRLGSLLAGSRSDCYRQNAEHLLAVFESRLKDMAMAVPLMCCAADMVTVPSRKQVVLVGHKPSIEFENMLVAAHASYDPNKTVIHLDPSSEEEMDFWEEHNSNVALMAKNNFAADKVVALVCQNFTCSAPITDPGSLKALLSQKASSSA